MLALGPEQVRRGGRGVSGLQVRTTLAWQAPPTTKPHAQDQGMSIRQKISQWEGRCSQDADAKAHAPVLSRTVSGDGLGDGLCGDGLGRVPQGRALLSKAKSLGLDFREAQTTAPGRRSEPPPQQNCLNEIASAVPQTKPLVVHSQSPPKVDADTSSNCKQIITTNGELNVDCLSDGEVVSKLLPPSADDQEDSMPSGNFYTSRGFWRRLEGDKLLWDKARECSGDLEPAPPKPQRTFQYRGAGDGTQCLVQWDRRFRPKRGGIAQPPSFPPPPCPAAKTNGLSRHKKNRKSFEYEDAAHLTSQQQGMLGGEATRRSSGLYHAFSDDSIYEDIVCEEPRENPYEDVKFSPARVQIGRPKPWTVSLRQNPQAPKLPPKPQTLQYYAGKVERREPNTVTSPSPSTLADTSKPAAPKHTSTQKPQRQPQYVSRIRMTFEAKRGRKRVKSQGGSVREETSGTESDPEDGTRGSRRSVYIQSTLRRRPGYRTLERDLIQLQQQQLFQLFVVVSLRKGGSPPGNAYSPQITQQFPKFFEKASRHSREAEDRLKVIPMFCFPDAQDWRPSADTPSETFSFVLTGEDGSRWFGYCRKILPSGKGKRLPEVHCIVSRLGCFNLFAKDSTIVRKYGLRFLSFLDSLDYVLSHRPMYDLCGCVQILEEVERRREMSPALVHSFMRSVMEAPFPAPGRTITVKSFLPGSGNEVLTLCRPVDSRLEHVDFACLLQCLSVARLLQVFASLLLERRVIFIADKLSVLSHCGHAVLALLYPFTWQHTFIPVLPTSMLDITCSPTPFLMGALAPCLPQLWELPIEEVLIVDLCADKFVVQLGDEDCILPNKLQAALQQVLEERDDILRQEAGDSSIGQQNELSSLVSEAFVRFFVELVGHYPLHMAEAASSSGGACRELQRDSFRKSHPSRGVRQFLQLFMDTQMFAGFIQDKELRKGAGKGLFETRAAEYLDSCQEPGPSGVNKFLKGLGNKMKFLQIK